MNRSLLITVLILMFILISQIGAACEQDENSITAMGSCGEKSTWVLYETSAGSNTYDLQIIGSGAMSDWGAHSSPWNDYKDGIISVIVGKGITTVGAHAFYECSKLTSVTLPNELDSIGIRAFALCPRLSVLKFADKELVLPSIDISRSIGDVNDDGTVNGKDSMLLLQYLAGWDVSFDADSADINDDGTVNGKDSMLLLQYLAGWESATIK